MMTNIYAFTIRDFTLNRTGSINYCITIVLKVIANHLDLFENLPTMRML